jgi:hypothetical protein
MTYTTPIQIPVHSRLSDGLTLWGFIKVSDTSKVPEGLINEMRRLGSLSLCEPLKPVLPSRAATHNHNAISPLTR